MLGLRRRNAGTGWPPDANTRGVLWKTARPAAHQIMHDADIGFADDGQIKVQQVIVIFVHRAGQRILDRNNGCLHLLLGQIAKKLTNL